MKNLVKNFRHHFQGLMGPVYGYVSVIVGLIADLIAILLFPEFDLSFMISALGAGPGGFFFNIGLILSGLFALPFYLYLVQVVKKEEDNIILIKLAKRFSIISSIFYSFIGIFPAINQFDILLLFHGLSVVISWISACVYLTAFGIIFLKNSQFFKFHGYLSFATAITFMIALTTWNPITEWIMTFAIIIWIIIIASHSIVKGLLSSQ